MKIILNSFSTNNDNDNDNNYYPFNINKIKKNKFNNQNLKKIVTIILITKLGKNFIRICKIWNNGNIKTDNHEKTVGKEG